MLQAKQRLGEKGGPRACQKLPRSRGFWEPVTQSADNAVAAPPGAQLPRLSSARANTWASFGSLLAVSGISRLRVQAIAERRAGRVSPWHDQPLIRRLAASRFFMK